MVNQQQKKRPTKQIQSDDQIDLFELLHFIVNGKRYILSGALIFALMAIIYALAMYPSNFRQQTINDLGLTEERLNLVRQVMPAMTFPLSDMMQAKGLESLYVKITRGGSAYLEDAIYGLSGVDLSDKKIDQLSKEKIETVVVDLKGKDHELMKREGIFIRNSIKGVSQFLKAKSFIDNQISTERIELFDTEAKVIQHKIMYERIQLKLDAYESLKKESEQVKDLQIILSLSNNESEFSGAKYLPISNRIIGLKSEMADIKEQIRILQLQIQAFKLSQKVLSDLLTTIKKTPYQGDVIDFEQAFELIHDYRQQREDYTYEEIGALDNLERKIINFNQYGFKFSNSLPMVIEKKGRISLVGIATLLGGFLGLSIYIIMSLVNVYSRRYKN